MTTVACVMRSGGAYNSEWVRKLAAGVRAHGGQGVTCLTDLDYPPTLDGVTWVRLAHDWPGWYSKLELFRPGVFEGPVLYLDLDTLVLGPLHPLLKVVDGLPSAELGILTDFYHPERAQSCVMAWTPGHESDEIYRAWATLSEPSRRTWWSDQPFIDAARPDAFRLQDFMPSGYFASFKVHGRDGPPAGCSVLCFHGRPRPSDPAAGWAHNAWVAL